MGEITHGLVGGYAGMYSDAPKESACLSGIYYSHLFLNPGKEKSADGKESQFAIVDQSGGYNMSLEKLEEAIGRGAVFFESGDPV